MRSSTTALRTSSKQASDAMSCKAVNQTGALSANEQVTALLIGQPIDKWHHKLAFWAPDVSKKASADTACNCSLLRKISRCWPAVLPGVVQQALRR